MMEGASPGIARLGETRAWALLRALAVRAGAGTPLTQRTEFDFDGGDTPYECRSGAGLVAIDPESAHGFVPRGAVDGTASELFELYLPLCTGERSAGLVLGHVGQSLDGQTATATGASRYVTGPQNIRHMHRLRALFDAVIVGARTVEIDDPKLTTRLVAGRNPTRVVIDPHLRLPTDRAVFSDPTADTLVVCREDAIGAKHEKRQDLIPLAATGERLAVAAIVKALRARGLSRLFVEGGGVTVSHFLSARAFDRLHVSVCPLFLGIGRPGIVLPGIDGMDAALRPRARRFGMGDDVLFDCAFER